jgi:hypothetical protein
MNHSSNDGDESVIDDRITSLRDSVPSAVVESRLQLRMRHHWEALSTRGRKSERSPNNYKIWLIVSTAAALLFSTAILLFQHEKQVADGLRRTNLKSMGATVEFKSVLSKETDPCNILPPLPDSRS